MASITHGGAPIGGRVDRDGRLIEADPELLRLQREAGSALGAPLALPQLAAVVRAALQLGVPLSRAVIAASAEQDYDLWIRAEPDADGARLTIDGWAPRPPAPPRLTLVASGSADEPNPHAAPPTLTLRTDPELRLTAVDPDLAESLGLTEDAIGAALTRYFLLFDDGEGGMALLTGLGGRQDFAGQQARLRAAPDTLVTLAGTAIRVDDRFAGYAISVDFGAADATDLAAFDPSLDQALRSPLDRIIAAADRIVERSDGPLRSDYAAYAGDIAAAGRHLLSVIRSMSDQPAPGGTSADLEAAVAEAVQLVQSRADERGIIFESDREVDDVAPTARADPREVIQILVNLIGNAVRHSPDGGVVRVERGRREAMLYVSVADDGPGIDPADQQRIFERYERVGDTPDGTGLGLAIARRLARGMGGEIELVSTPGAGARFTLVLPAA